MPQIPIKWNYNKEKQYICANTTVTNKNVREVVDWAIDEVPHDCMIRVWSGVHGVPGGSIQIDDPQFYEVDKNLPEKLDCPAMITVNKMEVTALPPAALLTHIRDKKSIVVLAWCHSKGYLHDEASYWV
jgi:hypothetical protein